MAFLGFFGKRKQAAPFATPGIGDQSSAPTDNWYDPLPSQQAASKPSKVAQILGVVGDAMQTWGGGQATFVPQLLDVQERTAAEKRQIEMYKQRREDERSDFLWKQQNTPPDVPPIVRDAQAWAAMTPEQKAQYQALEDVRNPVIRQGGDGLPYTYSRPPVAPVGKLTILPGGGVGNGTGNFR